jgi:hypothetical protein
MPVKSKDSRSADRHRRLAAELRANLGKRKEQARTRAAAERARSRQAVDKAGAKDD